MERLGAYGTAGWFAIGMIGGSDRNRSYVYGTSWIRHCLRMHRLKPANTYYRVPHKLSEN